MNPSVVHNFEFLPDACGHVLKDRRLQVPVYQRSYSWTDEEIEEFWDDIKSSFAKEDSEYFLGTIVLSLEGSKGAFTVIDGQQRLATTSLVFAAIRDEFKRRGDDERANILQEEYLSKRDINTKENIPRLKLNSEDDHFYRLLVIEGQELSTIKTTTKSHRLIAGAFSQLKKFVQAAAADVGREWEKRLLQWVSFLTERLRVIVVQVPTEADAFVIFETLNDRGADLTIADLLKNYLFGRAGKNLDTVRDGWMSALGTLEMSAENALFVTFIRHYWSSKYGATRERLLFKGIRQEVTTSSQALAFSNELKEASRLYAALLNSEHEYWSGLGSKAKSNIETLARFGLEQNRPLLIAAMQHFDRRELARTLRALVSWSVRGIVAGGIGAGKTERYYSQAAVGIRKGAIKNASQLLSELSDIIPTDEEFQNIFAVSRVSNAKLARYFLIALERSQSGEKEPELVPNANEEELNLEHILPKNAKLADWPSFDEDEQRAWVSRLGNMVLLPKGPNGRIGNKPWANKKAVLAKSKLALTQTASRFVDWNKASIDQRQRKLAELAVRTWPRKA